MTFLGYVYKKSLFKVYRFKCKWAVFPPLSPEKGVAYTSLYCIYSNKQVETAGV